ncbi:MAG: GldG family protein [Clostridia bacterium]|nr:GldG family protein [Clostridia bacterium]
MKNENTESNKKGLFSQTARRRFRFGTNMIVLAVLVIVVFVIVNVVLESFSSKLTLDLTSEKLYTIGDVTKRNMESLEKDVEIIALYDRVKGEADSNKVAVIKVLDLYEPFEKITVSYVDPDSHPNFILDTVGAANANSYSEGDYIVKCGDKTRRIPESDMYVTSTTMSSSGYSYEYQSGMQAERKLTTAILYVAADVSPIIYYMTGHGEESISDFSEIVTYLEGLGADVRELDFSSVTQMPEDAAVAIFMGPKYDINSNEKTILQQWLEQKAGQLVLCVNPLQSGTEFANFNSLLEVMFGLRLNNDTVSDDTRRLASVNSAYWFLGKSVSNGPIEKSSVYDVPVFESRTIEVLNVDESSAGINHYPIIQTYNTAVTTQMIGGAKSTEGVFTVGAAAKNLNFNEISRAAVFGSTTIFTDKSYDDFTGPVSRSLSIFAMSVDWMIESYGDNPASEISAKNYSSSQLIVSDKQGNALGIIAAVVVPLVIVGVGLAVWLKRRHL